MKRERIDPELRRKVLERDGYRCRYCGSQQEPFHLDHVYPFSKGGETTIDNLVTSCQKCNFHKHDKVGMWPNPINKEENKNGIFAFAFLIIGIGIATSPLAPHFPRESVATVLFFGAMVCAIGVFYVYKSISS